MNRPPPDETATRLGLAGLMLLISTALHAFCLQSLLGDPQLSVHFMSQGLWLRVVTGLGGRFLTEPPAAVIDWLPLWLIEAGLTLVLWLAGAAWLARRGRRWSDALADWGLAGWSWLFLAGSWELVRLTAFAFGWEGGQAVLESMPEFWQAIALAGWATTFLTLARSPTPAALPAPTNRVPWIVWGAVAVYFLCFGMMNGRLYAGLLIPHGDSAMYEEHLWNLLHGKGFRSYLDQGLFLGEHIQVIHLLLIPLYLLWPSHLLLELCESAALALGAIPVFRMTFRHTQDRRAAAALAIAYLLYFPTQRLDISIDFKTFRPEAFGIPLLLAALDALDRLEFFPAGRRGYWLPVGIWLLLTLLVKEDYAIIFAPLGLWIALCPRSATLDPAVRKRRRVIGLSLAVVSTVYLWLAVSVLIPYFRPHQAVHYLGYFGDFGKTLPEILFNMVTQPGRLWAKLVTAENTVYALALLIPLGFLPLLSPSRLAVGVPLFVILSLNQIAGSHNPQHHFHAPLVAIAFWAAAGGLPHLSRLKLRAIDSRTAAVWGCGCALATGLFLSATPLGVGFWDSGSPGWWGAKYVIGPRAEQFPKVLALVPRESRVASTDFIHPRFTHHARSYDYSGYRPVVPEDADYLVIDVRGPYSQVRGPEDVKEFHDRDRWELLPDVSEGYFLVFRRKR